MFHFSQERRLPALLLQVPESAQGLGRLTCVVVACLQATLLHVQESPQGRVRGVAYDTGSEKDTQTGLLYVTETGRCRGLP